VISADLPRKCFCFGDGEAAQNNFAVAALGRELKVQVSFSFRGVSRVKKTHSGGVFGRDAPSLRFSIGVFHEIFI
jgi:hypothetical protein